jgi:hypothetical protein
MLACDSGIAQLLPTQFTGQPLFQLACEYDLEGIVAKCKSEPYLTGHANWQKIRNTNYSQWAGQEELFERERGSDPDWNSWNACALACELISA